MTKIELMRLVIKLTDTIRELKDENLRLRMEVHNVKAALSKEDVVQLDSLGIEEFSEWCRRNGIVYC